MLHVLELCWSFSPVQLIFFSPVCLNFVGLFLYSIEVRRSNTCYLVSEMCRHLLCLSRIRKRKQKDVSLFMGCCCPPSLMTGYEVSYGCRRSGVSKPRAPAFCSLFVASMPMYETQRVCGISCRNRVLSVIIWHVNFS